MDRSSCMDTAVWQWPAEVAQTWCASTHICLYLLLVKTQSKDCVIRCWAEILWRNSCWVGGSWDGQSLVEIEMIQTSPVTQVFLGWSVSCWNWDDSDLTCHSSPGVPGMVSLSFSSIRTYGHCASFSPLTWARRHAALPADVQILVFFNFFKFYIHC